MNHCTWKCVSWQINSIRNSLGQQQGLPFVDLLTPDMLREVAGKAAESSEPIYTPLVTMWMFLGQVVDPDPGCSQPRDGFTRQYLPRPDQARQG